MQKKNPHTKLRSFCHKALGLSLYLSLFLYLWALPALPSRTGKLITISSFLLLLTCIILEGILYVNRHRRRIRPLLRQRLSGCIPLAVLIIAYLGCALLNLSYSPVRTLLLEKWIVPAGGLLLWLGILFYADGTEILNNLIMCTTASGLIASIYSLTGFPSENDLQLIRITIAGLFAGAIFFLAAQYNRRFKAVVCSALAAILVPSIWRSSIWNASVTQTSYSAGEDAMHSALEQLEGYSTPEVLLGRGSGYDLSFTSGQGVHNFLLADILNGGVLRFSIGLALWLCIIYFIMMLFLEQRGISVIYLGALGIVLAQSLFSTHTDFLTDSLFWPFCALLSTELTLIKTGKSRFFGQSS